MTRPMSSSKTTLPVGVKALDRVVAHLHAGARLVLSNEPGVELHPVLAEAAATHLSEGRKVVYAALTRSPDNVREEVRTMGATGEHLERLFVVDMFSAMLGTDGQAEVRVEDPEDPHALVHALEGMAKEHPDAIVILDSLSGLADRASMAGLRASFSPLAEVLGCFPCSLVAFTTWPYGGEYQDLLDTFEGEVRFGRMDARGRLGTYFQVRRADWDPDAAGGGRHLYRMVPSGGLHVYIPKIVVTGPSNAGKSTFVRTVSDEAVSVDRFGTTVALDHGHVRIDGLTADLFGTPGQVRFDPLLRTVADGALGVIVLVDSTRPSSFPRVRELVAKTRSQGLAPIVVASKQDLDGALDAKALAEELSLADDVETMGCSSHDPASCQAVLGRVLSRILDGGAGL